jgi:hypothetical protein
LFQNSDKGSEKSDDGQAKFGHPNLQVLRLVPILDNGVVLHWPNSISEVVEDIVLLPWKACIAVQTVVTLILEEC